MAAFVLCFVWPFVGVLSRPDAVLDHVARLTEPALHFPSSAVLVDAYESFHWGPDGTSYYRVQMQRSDTEEFMQQEAVKSYWPKGNAVAGHLLLSLKFRWWDAYRCRNSRSWEGKGHRADLDVVITVCLDDPDLATVCFFVQSW